MRFKLTNGWNRLKRELGVSGLLAIVLIFASGCGYFWAESLKAKSRSFKREVDNTRKVVNAASNTTLVLTKRLDAASQLVSRLNDESMYKADLKLFFVLAKKNGITVQKAVYQTTQETQIPLISHAAAFPLKGDYRSMKNFAADVLNNLPNSAMVDFRIHRIDAQSEQLEAQVRFLFLYRVTHDK